MILVWTLSSTSLQCHTAKVHVMGLGEQRARKEGKSAKPLWGADHDTKKTLQVGCCKDTPLSIVLLKTTAKKLCHCVIPASKNQVQTKVFNTTNTVHLQDVEYQLEDIRGFVTYKYNTKQWLTCVLQVNDSEIQPIFLHPSGPNKSFTYPSTLDILCIPASKVLTKVDTETVMGHTYVISEKESCCHTEKLETRLCRL
jgi:hypothetical protein